MQTYTRPSFAATLGWYVVGVLASLTGWSLVDAIQRVTGGAFSSLVALGMASTATLLMVSRGVAGPRRTRVAFALGVLTPLVVFALGVAYILWAFAHSDWQF